jgi:uncharacterized repeat protein (TIGR01451 family)
MLAGYPVDGSQFGQTVTPGTMYQTQPEPNPLSLAADPVTGQQEVYTANWFLSYPGNSGGPLYVQLNGYYYPAGVYLGTLYSGAQPYASAVRAMDSSVVNLITNAAALGDAGTNNTGGGVITLIAGQASASNPAYVQVTLGPPTAVSAGAGWRLQGDSGYGTAANYTREVTGTSTALQFKPISGWNLPTNQSVALTAGQLTIIAANYTLAADLAAGINGPADVAANDNYAYTLWITNLGPSAASSVTVTDALPAGAVFVSASGGGTNRTGVVTWPAVASLNNGGTTNYTLSVKAPALTLGTVTNTLSVGSSTPDPNPANGTFRLVTEVLTPPVLVVNRTNSLSLTGATGTTYQIQYTTNLVPGSWLVLQTNTIGVAGVTNVLSWSRTNGPARYYRAVWLP